MGWRSVHTASASDTPASPAMRIPVAAVRCARAASSAPIAWAVRVEVATASESGTMKQSAARFATIWWPAITLVPSRATSRVMNVKDVASIA